jgi:acetyl-CoA synthetase
MIAIKNKNQFNLANYEQELTSFSWNKVAGELDKIPGGKGMNIAYEAVDRHAMGDLKDTVALRFIRKDKSIKEFTYSELKLLTSKFANILKYLNLNKGDRVFSLAGRIPELYITALGTLKYTAVFCPLFSVFGPEPIFQRLSKGDAKVLLTTSGLYDKKIKQLMEKLPSLEYILLADAEEHLSEKVLSFPKLMANVSEKFTIPETKPEDPALLHFTSGTTGMPKGALHVHEAVLTHYITGKYVLDFKPGDIFGAPQIRVGSQVLPMALLHPW